MTEYHTFVVPGSPVVDLYGPGDDASPPSYTAVTIPMPEWATDEMIHKVLTAITRWRYAHTNPTELMVYVPALWLTQRDRELGHGGPSQILGVPLEYARVPRLIVGMVASGE